MNWVVKRTTVTLSMLPAAALWLAALCSCRALLYPIIATAPEPTRKVAAEVDRLSGHRVLVLVWADQATLFDYPYIRFELAEYVAYHLKEKVKNVGLVANREVATYQQSSYDWENVPPARIGARFDADWVIHVELLEYTTHGAGTGHLLSGRSRASVTVYEVGAESGHSRLYQGEAKSRYPDQGSVGLLEASPQVVHARNLDLLGQDIARKFYDHEIPL